jgi:hypothetical protein
MQIIEVGILGVRSAVITLRSRDSPMEIVLFPMIHLGTPAFYRAVRSMIGDCQVVVAEGIKGASPSVSLLTLSYRLTGRNRRLGLVQQDDLGLDALDARVIRPDMTGAQFEQRWRQSVPPWQRALLWCAAPLFSVGLMVFGSRRMLGRHLALDDLPTREQELEHDALGDLEQVVIDERDALVVEVLERLHAEYAEPVRVGVVYGAGHVPGIAAALVSRLGYHASSAEWLTVFDI